VIRNRYYRMERTVSQRKRSLSFKPWFIKRLKRDMYTGEMVRYAPINIDTLPKEEQMITNEFLGYCLLMIVLGVVLVAITFIFGG